MAVTVRNSSWGGSSTLTSDLLVSYITDEIRVLEPELYYANLGVRRDVPAGWDRLNFPQTNQLPVRINVSIEGALGGSVFGAGASIQGGQASDARGWIVSSTQGVAAITEGTNPTSISWGATSYSSGPYQFGILIQVSDLLVHNSAIEVVDACARQVRTALARLVDTALSTAVNAGTNGVLYTGGKTTRAGLAAGDLLTQTDMNRAYRNLAASNGAGVKPFGGEYYVAVIHPFPAMDLKSNSATGSFQDVGRYTSVEELKMGKLGSFRGIRYLECGFQHHFASTVNVFPTTVLGDQSFGWGYFQQPQAILTTGSDSNNALNLYTSIGGKVTLGVTRFEDALGIYRIVRVESATSS